MKYRKVLALLSGGLDSTLAVKIVKDQGVDLEAVHFTTPFCLCDKCAVNAVGEEMGVKVHYIFMGQEFLNLLADPPHGYGSQMNICIDCRILMFRKARELAKEIGAEGIVTGEVLNERPFSQRPWAMRLIEREAGLEGRVLRPLSAKLLPESELEKDGAVDRDGLYSIRGRRRLPQMRLAEELGIRDYPCPSGGCLLTDPNFSKRLRDYIEHEGKLTVEQVSLLRLGRHFRLGAAKVIVGRNEDENRFLFSVAERDGIPRMRVADYMGPYTLIMGEADDRVLDRGAAITVRYSDAPKGSPVKVTYIHGNESTIFAQAIGDEELDRWRV